MGERCHAIFLVSTVISFESIVAIELNFKVITLPLYVLEVDLMSEVTFRYNVLQRFINFDETHLTKSSEGDKSGPQATTCGRELECSRIQEAT